MPESWFHTLTSCQQELPRQTPVHTSAWSVSWKGPGSCQSIALTVQEEEEEDWHLSLNPYANSVGLLRVGIVFHTKPAMHRKYAEWTLHCTTMFRFPFICESTTRHSVYMFIIEVVVWVGVELDDTWCEVFLMFCPPHDGSLGCFIGWLQRNQLMCLYSASLTDIYHKCSIIWGLTAKNMFIFSNISISELHFLFLISAPN